MDEKQIIDESTLPDFITKPDISTTEIVKSTQALTGIPLELYNPDELVQNKGRGVKLYQDMYRDPYVKAALELKKSAIIATPYTIQANSSEPRDVMAADFVRWMLEHMEHSFSKFLWSMMDAIDCGYSLHERVFGVAPSGKWAGKWMIRKLSSKDPYVWEFNLDEFNNIKSIASVYDIQNKSYPPNKFVIFSYNSRYQNPYGMADLRSSYRAFFLKDCIWKFRGLYLEKFGMPPIYGQFPPGTSREKQEKLLKVIQTIQTETAMIIPSDIQLKVLELATLGKQTEFERAIADLNKEILIGILGSFLQIEEGKRGGVRAQQTTSMKVSQLFTERLARAMEEEINRQIISPVSIMNFPVDEAPKLIFELDNNERDSQSIEIDKALHDIGFPLSNEYLAKKYRRQLEQEQQTVQMNPAAPAPEESDDSVPDQQEGLEDDHAPEMNNPTEVESGEDAAEGAAASGFADSATFLSYVKRRRGKAYAEAGSGKKSDLVRAYREILDFCEARDNKNYPNSIAHSLADRELLCKEKLGNVPTADEAAMWINSSLKMEK